MTDEVSLKEFLEAKFGHVNERIDGLAKEVCGLRKKYDDQQRIHVDCLARQSKERGALWSAIDEQGRQLATANGFVKGQAHAEERAGWRKYVDWVKITAIATIVAGVVALLSKYL